MNAHELAQLMLIAAQLVERLNAIAKNDPAVWEEVRTSYAAAVQEFKNATRVVDGEHPQE